MKKFILTVILTLPYTAHAKTCYFYPSCERRINLSVLQTEISTVSNVILSESDCISWNKYPYQNLERPEHIRESDIPVNPSLPWVEPRAIKAEGVPENVTCQQVQNFLVAHNPTETTEEEKQRRAIENRDAKLNELPTIQDMLQRLDALEGN